MELKYQTAKQEEKLIQATIKKLAPYFQHLQKVSKEKKYDYPESSINLSINEALLKEVLKLKKEKITGRLEYILVIAIGGSNLGAKAVYDAIYGAFDLIDFKRFPRIIFLDTCDPEFLRRLQNFLQFEIKKPEQILINIISKSGSTTETIANAEIVIKALKKNLKQEQIDQRIVVTSDEGTKLWKWAAAKKISKLSLPKTVGGRYCVFSSVGLFPLALAGIDIKGLRDGAANMRKKCLTSANNNPAMISAALLCLNAKDGKTINDNFFFVPHLESVGKWYRQLMGESIGKEQDVNGKTVNTGITPTYSIGSTDLHSVGQLYLGGPLDKFTTFIWAKNPKDQMSLPKTLLMPGIIENLEGKSAQSIMSAILEGIKAAYSKKKLPYMEVILEEISTYALGEFLQFKMFEMMYLGKLMNVNTFDQPNVELYKIETRKILSK